MRGVFSGFMRRTSWFGTPSRFELRPRKNYFPTAPHANNQPREQTKTSLVSLCESLITPNSSQDSPKTPGTSVMMKRGTCVSVGVASFLFSLLNKQRFASPFALDPAVRSDTTPERGRALFVAPACWDTKINTREKRGGGQS